METLSASLHNGGVEHLRKSSIVGRNIRNQRNKIAAVYIRQGQGRQNPMGDSVSLSRAQWQSSCAILTSNAVAQQQETEKPANGALVPVNGSARKESSAITMLDGLPKPLTIADLSPAPMHGNQLRVAYQGVPGAYSEAAASKAYPSCEAIPCDQFEVAFQAVELWLADRAVLPVENSLGGSIHRNYDLMLRHRLHIVGEVQLPVHHCLMALPGVDPREDLRRVISHPQALAQCELTLTKLGLDIAREAFDDTAGAAEYIALNNLRAKPITSTVKYGKATQWSAKAASPHLLEAFPHIFYYVLCFTSDNRSSS